jgi:hypothetical protein
LPTRAEDDPRTVDPTTVVGDPMAMRSLTR